jgi:hypothetical protein
MANTGSAEFGRAAALSGSFNYKNNDKKYWNGYGDYSCA